jgi:hypothetical protein
MPLPDWQLNLVRGRAEDLLLLLRANTADSGAIQHRLEQLQLVIAHGLIGLTPVVCEKTGERSMLAPRDGFNIDCEAGRVIVAAEGATSQELELLVEIMNLEGSQLATNDRVRADACAILEAFSTARQEPLGSARAWNETRGKNA